MTALASVQTAQDAAITAPLVVAAIAGFAICIALLRFFRWLEKAERDEGYELIREAERLTAEAAKR